MRYFYLLLALAVSMTSFAQRNLSGGPQHSIYTYIYKLDTKEAERLARTRLEQAGEKYLHSLVDSFKRIQDEPALPPGNYLFVDARANKLVYALRTVGDLEVSLVSNDHDLSIAVHTRQGRMIPDAEVYLDQKHLDYRADTKTYGRMRTKQGGWIRLTYRNVFYSFPFDASKERHAPFFSRLAAAFPFKYIVPPMRKLLEKKQAYGYDDDGARAYERKFKGFIVFSKPKYKPGDTVRLKAFIETTNGRPVNKPLLLRLSCRSADKDTVLTTLAPYRAGGYESRFVLSDSLGLELDEDYTVSLEGTGRSHKKDHAGGAGGDSRRKVLMRGHFAYEEYELKSVRFSARSSSSEHRRGEELALFLKAADENDLAVMDGRVQIRVLPDDYAVQEFHAPRVFLPDTLWFHTQALDNLGETKIILPDSIFPRAAFAYTVECVFLNANNEVQKQELSQVFHDNRQTISFDLQQDSLKISFPAAGNDRATPAMLIAFNKKEDTIGQRSISLPAVIPVDPFAASYEVISGNVDERYKLKPPAGVVSCLALRTADSVSVQLVNPYRLPVWYTVFAGSRIVLRGYGDTLRYEARASTPKNYFVSLQYIYAGEVRRENYTIPFQDKQLKIDVRQPALVYPGQTAEVDVKVTDSKGRAVANADVTAYAFTGKFRSSAPVVPYLGKHYPWRRRSAFFTLQEHEAMEHAALLNWARWSREMALDTMAYYQFLHPGGIAVNREPAPDSLTQLSPFVVIRGELQPVHMLYIDEKPVFFSQAQQMQRYSFRVAEGRHALRLRTHNLLIRLDSIWIEKGMKTFISMEADTANKRIHLQQMPDSMTTQEKELWSRYMILVENNFGGHLSYIRQDQRMYLLNEHPESYQPLILAGPLTSHDARLVVKGGLEQDFEPEGSWQYQVGRGLVRQKQLRNPYPFRPTLPASAPTYEFRDFVLTETEIDSLWQEYLDQRSHTTDLFYRESLDKAGAGRLRIGFTKDQAKQLGLIKNVILFRYDRPDFIRIYSGASRDLGYLQPANYRLFFLLKNNDYGIWDSLPVRAAGLNYQAAGDITIRRKDSTSAQIAAIIESRDPYDRYVQGQEDLGHIGETFNLRYLDTGAFSETVSGTIVDRLRHGVPGAAVTIKGTRNASFAGEQGQFWLRVPAQAVLVVTAIGFESQELHIRAGLTYHIVLKPTTNYLQEVVVVGYGVRAKMNLTGSVSSFTSNTLQGKVAGLMVRGTRSLESSGTPLVIINGLPYAGSLGDIDQGQIVSMDVLEGPVARNLYGAQGANGVVIITTARQQVKTNAGELPEPGNAIRRNFHDDAYWQPALRTDDRGHVSFRITFPDDITSWRTFVMAMDGRKGTGFSEGAVKSFKALSGNLALPQFALSGDSMQVIGKTLNYLSDSIRVQRHFSVNGVLVREDMISLRNARIDTFSVAAPDVDSLTFKYTIRRESGYFDGEERTVPVWKPGVQETTGFFAALNQDTVFRVTLKDTGAVRLYAESSLLPVFYEETETLRKYEYLCNEQLASKLKAMLVQKKIDQYLKRPFTGEQNIRSLIGRLMQGRLASGLWGWWGGTEPSWWISLHVLQALVAAQNAGYKVPLDKQALIDYLVYNLEREKSIDPVSCLYLLHALAAKADYPRYLDSIGKKPAASSLYERLRMAELRQQLGMPIVPDTLVAKQQHTAFGNVYWGEENSRFFDNAIQNTLCMYRILKQAGGYQELLQRTRNYFLEKRKDGHWRNTYEASLILETILPDLLTADTLSRPASLAIQGKVSFNVQRFPFAAEIKGGGTFSVTKQGHMPVYFTAYQQHWNSGPERVEGNFVVDASFQRDGQAVSRLKAGDPVVLQVVVSVRADADYVLVEIPIPAGCTYQDKNQPHLDGEVHREYFRNKVSIFCESMPKGTHRFSVSLLPRFAGLYTLNPAKAELMYFPVLNGREGMRKVRIE